MPHFTFSLIDRLSSCAMADSRENIIEQAGFRESMFSRSNRTETPCSRSFSTYVWQSTMLREKREMDFTRMMSIFPSIASAIIRWNPARCLALIALLPSSE